MDGRRDGLTDQHESVHSSSRLSIIQGAGGNFSSLQWSLQSPDLNPVDYPWDVEEQEVCIANMQ